MTEKILPCPFCQAPAILDYRMGTGFVACAGPSCNVCGPDFPYPAGAIAAWNAVSAAVTDRTDNAVLRSVLFDVTIALTAAISLLKNGGKPAAGSDKMFDQMLLDYQAAAFRAALYFKEPVS